MTTVALIHSPFTSAAAWGRLPDVLRSAGFTVVVPEVHDDDAPPFASHFVARASQQLHADAGSDQLVLVGHGGAGPLLPQIAFARRSLGAPVSGYVFVDADLPRTGRPANRLDLLEAEDPVHSAELSQLLADGKRLPDWSEVELADTVTDVQERAVLLAGLRPRGLEFYTEQLPVPQDWPDAPCGYVQLSDAGAAAARIAAHRGWPVERRDAHHFWALTNPEGCAAAITPLL